MSTSSTPERDVPQYTWARLQICMREFGLTFARQARACFDVAGYPTGSAGRRQQRIRHASQPSAAESSGYASRLVEVKSSTTSGPSGTSRAPSPLMSRSPLEVAMKNRASRQVPSRDSAKAGNLWTRIHMHGLACFTAALQERRSCLSPTCECPASAPAAARRILRLRRQELRLVTGKQRGWRVLPGYWSRLQLHPCADSRVDV